MDRRLVKTLTINLEKIKNGKEVLIIVTMHARGRSSSGFQGESRFFQS
jgi:hypothetical protein